MNSKTLFFQSISAKDYYQTREFYNILRNQYFSLKKEYEQQLNLKFCYKQKIISPLRAISMDKNIFVKEDFKKLRAALQQYKKDSVRFAKNFEEYNQREEKLKKMES